MPKIFISHSNKDSEISSKLADFLRRDGAEVWIDSTRISGGDSLPDAIGKGIDWCDTFILIWSKSAKNSRYVKMEWKCAFNIDKRIIPCVIDDGKLPTFLSHLLYIDFKDFEKGYLRLAGDLKLTIKEKEQKPELDTIPSKEDKLQTISDFLEKEKDEIKPIPEIEPEKKVAKDKKITYSARDQKNWYKICGIIIVFVFLFYILFLGITEMDTLDLRFKLRGEIPGDPRILLIDIDDQSASLRPPWNLEQLEKLLIPILQRQPAAIGLDLRFYDHPKNYEGDLQQFINRIASYSVPIILAVGFRDDQLLKPDLQTVPPNVHFGSVTLIDKYYPESDNVARRVRLLTAAQGDFQPILTFALQMLCTSENKSPIQCLAELSDKGLTKSPEEYHLIRYSNNYLHSHPKLYNDEKFGAIQAKMFLDQSHSTEFENDLNRLIQDSTIVILGATYQSFDLAEDWFQTPLSWNKTISGVVVHTNILSWLLGRKYIAGPGFFWYAFLTLALVIFTWGITHFFTIKKSRLILSSVFLLYVITISLIFIIWEIWLPIVWPLHLSILFFFITSIKKLQILRTTNG